MYFCLFEGCAFPFFRFPYCARRHAFQRESIDIGSSKCTFVSLKAALSVFPFPVLCTPPRVSAKVQLLFSFHTFYFQLKSLFFNCVKYRFIVSSFFSARRDFDQQLRQDDHHDLQQDAEAELAKRRIQDREGFVW